MRRAITTVPHRLTNGLATAAQSTSKAAAPLPFQVTTLPNGVRVCTDPTPGHFVAAGVYVDGGSRYEGTRTRGAGHMVDRTAFKSTKNRTAAQMTSEIEALGGQFQASSSRETIMYQSSTYTRSLPSVLSILSDTVLNPNITAEEVDAQRDAVAYEIREIKDKPEMILPEILHEVAYKGNTLGNPLLCPEENLATMTPETIKEFMGMWYRPERIVVAAAGVEHGHMVDLVEQYFGEMKRVTPTVPPIASSRTVPSPTKPTISKFLSTSASAAAAVLNYGSTAPPETFEALSTAPVVYTGGELYLEKPDMEFTHMYVAYEGLSIHDPDIYTLAVLQMLLGGGGSFSAGGPGKGMYSRLYTSVLNQHYAVDFCSAFHHCYLDSGLFGISLTVHPSFVPQMAALLATQFDNVTRVTRGGIVQADLNRAKNQLKSGLAMSLESRIMQVEDLGRQVQVHGYKVSMEEMSTLIDAVTLPDLFRVANRVLRPSTSLLLADRKKSGKPSIVVQGPLRGLKDVMDVFRRRGLAPEL